MKKLVPTIVLFFAVSVFSQEKPKAILVDEFGKVTCEDLLARIDNFHIQMSNNPTFMGLAVIRPDKGSMNRVRWHKKLIVRTFQRNRYEIDRIRVVLESPGDSIGGSFWLVPPGAEAPAFDESKWPDEEIDFSKPFVYEVYEVDDVCPTFVPYIYADLIKSRNVRGHIVIHTDSRRNERRVAFDWIKTLAKEHNVPRNRIKIYYGKRNIFQRVEFWIVPIKKQ